MHNIAREASGRSESMRNTVKETGPLDPSLKMSLLVLGVALGRQDTPEVVSIYLWVNGGEVGDVDVWVIVRGIVCSYRREQGGVIVRSSQFVAPD